jgi:hypothetical protein
MNLKIHMMKPGYPVLQERNVIIPLKVVDEYPGIKELKDQGFYVTGIDLE